jgi:N-acetyl-alpha-D-muramate 1-phosphate uridylyltransferase
MRAVEPREPCGAMILAAGRGERMRPLSDAVPKPLLEAGGKALIVWQIEALARAGFTRIVINAAHLADALVARLGDGRALGVSIAWSIESPEALETAGGIATALPLLPTGPALVVSADIHTDFDYATLLPRAAAMARDPAPPRVHLVMVDNPPYHPRGDFALVADPAGPGQRIARDGVAPLTFGNIGLYDTALFAGLPRRTRLKLLPLFHDWIGQGIVSGERHVGHWANVGTPDELARLDALLRARPGSVFPLPSATIPR